MGNTTEKTLIANADCALDRCFILMSSQSRLIISRVEHAHAYEKAALAVATYLCLAVMPWTMSAIALGFFLGRQWGLDFGFENGVIEGAARVVEKMD